jgi:hypothetical protein
MANSRRRWPLLAVVAICVLALPSRPASAITAELAKKCRALAIKAHPPQPAGTKTGAEQAQRDYYRDCIAKSGNMQEQNR